MSLFATTRGIISDVAATVTYTFTQSVDTTTLQPGQAFDLRSYLLSIGEIKSSNASLHLNVIIPSGINVYSSNISYPSITVANFHPNRDRVTITNNGNLYGAGGSGGAGGYEGNGSAGLNGGIALAARARCIVINNGKIFGGGGGNGGDGGIATPVYGWYDSGGRFNACSCCSTIGNTHARNTGLNPCLNGPKTSCVGNCVQQNACGGGCKTDTCGWPSCSGICGCNCCGGGQYQGVGNYQPQAYGQVDTTYSNGTAGFSGTLGGGTAGTTGNNNQYTGGTGGIYGLDIDGYANITYSGTGSTAGHVA